MGTKYLILDGPGDADKNRDGHLSATELSVSAAWLGLFGFLFLLGLVGLAGSWLLPFGPLRVVLFLADVALTVASAIGCWRHYAVFDRALRWQAADRQRLHRQEDIDREYRFGLADQVKTRITQTEIDGAVDTILTRYYAGKPWSRGTITGISDVLWNIANDTLKKAKIRRGRSGTLEFATYEEAWRAYLQWKKSSMHVVPDDDGGLIRQ